MNLTTSTFAPSAGTLSGNRGWAVVEALELARRAWSVGGGAGPPGSDDGASAATIDDASRGKNASAEAVPPRNSAASASASGLWRSTRQIADRPPRQVVMGIEVAAPEIEEQRDDGGVSDQAEEQTRPSMTNEA